MPKQKPKLIEEKSQRERFIETARPDVAVVGHIHEGRGVERIGDTLVLNAGALRDGGYVVVEHDGGELHACLRSFRD